MYHLVRVNKKYAFVLIMLLALALDSDRIFKYGKQKEIYICRRLPYI